MTSFSRMRWSLCIIPKFWHTFKLSSLFLSKGTCLLCLEHKDPLITFSLKRVLHNALLMLVVRDLALELYKPPPGMEKWNFCLQASKAAFGEVLSSMYLRQFTPAQLKNYHKKVRRKLLIFCGTLRTRCLFFWMTNRLRTYSIRLRRQL